MTYRIVFAVGTAAALLTAGLANATTIDFSALAPGTAVNNQYAGVVFSLQGGADSSGSPLTQNTFNGDGITALSNSNSGDYPTSDAVVASFSTGAHNVSFTFDNYGDNTGQPGSSYSAYDAANNLISTGSLSSVSGFQLISVAGSGITNLTISNGFGESRSWEFGIGQLSFTAGVPEPATWGLMLAGFAMTGLAARRRRNIVVA